jgi:glutamate-1-semialdehyde aminotransferase
MGGLTGLVRGCVAGPGEIGLSLERMHRVEFICAPGPLRNGTEAEAAHTPALEQAIHIALLNRGCLIAPFHNMMLVSPATTAAQVEMLRQAFESVVASLALDLGSWL